MLFSSLIFSALAQSPTVPSRQIPPNVLMELRLLENRFELALSMDCAAERCFSKGCTYLEHAVADQPRSMSLPGLAGDPGPGSVPPQEYLTRARCSFAHEKSIASKDVAALSRRLQSKLSQAWTVVSVGHQALPPIPQYLLEEPEPEAEPVDTDVPEPEPEPEPVVAPEWTFGTAVHELWDSLLPHFFWMVGLVLLALVTTFLIWAFRRVGQASFEEQALLAQLGMPEPEAPPENPDPDEENTSEVLEDPAFVATQQAAWNERLEAMEPGRPDPKVRALIRELLRAGELPLLAKAVLEFPETLPAAFPSGGEVAGAKLELAEYLKTVDTEKLPADSAFFRALNRHALAASLTSQGDAEVVRSLREEFGASGLSQLIDRLPARAGALLFALSPVSEQHEMVRLLSPERVSQLAQQLLRSNRMDDAETEYLFQVLTAVRNHQTLPAEPATVAVSDRGPTNDAAAALSVLLPQLNPNTRAALFNQALERFNGSLPAWYREIFFADLLFELHDEARADLLLELDTTPLAAWFSLLDRESRDHISSGIPGALRSAIQASSNFPSRTRQLALAEQGRRDLAAGFQRQLARANLSFEDVVRATEGP